MTSKEALRTLISNIELVMGSDEWYQCKEAIDVLEKDLERLEQIRKTFKVEKEETINQNLYWLYIEERPILITRKIYYLVKKWLEGE